MIDLLIILSGARIFFLCFSHSLSDIFVGSDLENLRSRYFARGFHIVESTLRISPCQKEFNRGSIQLQSRLYHFTIFHHCVRYHLHACSWKRIRLLLVPRLKADSRDRNEGETGGLPLPPQLYLQPLQHDGPMQHLDLAQKITPKGCRLAPRCLNADFFSADSQQVFRLCRHLHAAVPQGS